MRLKSLSLALFAVLFVTTLNAQDGYGITYKYLSSDFQGPITENYFDELEIKGVELGYFKPISDAFVLGFPLRVGVAKYALSETDATQTSKELFGSLDGTIIYRLNNNQILKKDSWFAPYLFGGIGGSYFEDQKFKFQAPVGLGINFQLAPSVALQAQSEYRISEMNHLHHSAGLFVNLGGGEQEMTMPVAPPAPPAPKDGDNDGIADADDKCPTVAGLAKFGGCPDTDEDGIEDSKDNCPKVAGVAANNGCPEEKPADSDNDGVIDKNDSCPNVAGIAKFNGCPDTDNDGIQDSQDECPKTAGLKQFNGCPDTDGDGIMDSKDKCPTRKGTLALGGCPDVDTDGDGVVDRNDKCPNTAGTVSNSGCPELKQSEKEILTFATRGVEFETGSSKIKSSSYAILDQVVGILNKYPAYNVSMNGYTDSVGNADNNQRLSESRAKACYEYLASKGISRSRMSYAGFGEANPIADNGTAAGRAKNRRVEFNIALRK